MTLPAHLLADPVAVVPLVNNPRTVAPSIERAEGGAELQAGVVRTVSVAGLAGDPYAGRQVLGSIAATQEAAMIASSTPFDEQPDRVTETGIYVDADGNAFQLREGDALPAGYVRREDAPSLTGEEISLGNGIAVGIPVGPSEDVATDFYRQFTEGMQAEYPYLRTPEVDQAPLRTPEGGAEPVTTPEKPETDAQRKKWEKAKQEAAAKTAADAAVQAEREAQG